MNRLMKVRRIGVVAVILLGILSVGLVSGCGKVSAADLKAQVEALEITPDNFEQCRQQLVAWANDGNIYAASKLCDMGLFFSMREVEPKNLEKWKDDPLKIGARTARQVYAVVYANHIDRIRPSSEFLAACKDALEILNKDAVDDYVIMKEWLWFGSRLDPDRDFDPELEQLRQLLESQKPHSAHKAELARWYLIPMCEPQIEYSASESLERAVYAVRLYRECGCDEGLESALYYAGKYSRPDNNSDGDWDRAISYFEEANTLSAKIGNEYGEAIGSLYMGKCQQPNLNPDGQWSRSVELYERSLDLCLKLEKYDVALNPLSLLVNSALRPDVNPDGDWARVGERCVQGANLCAEMEGKQRERGLFLAIQGISTCPVKNESGNWADSLELFEQAVQVFHECGDEENEKFWMDWVSLCRNGVLAESRDRSLKVLD